MCYLCNIKQIKNKNSEKIFADTNFLYYLCNIKLNEITIQQNEYYGKQNELAH